MDALERDFLCIYREFVNLIGKGGVFVFVDMYTVRILL